MRIQIGFSTSTSLQSRLVRWVTRSDVSHTFFVVNDSFLGNDMVFQADTVGVQLVTLATFEKKNRIVKLIEMPSSLVTGIGKVVSRLGSPYDYAGFFGSAFVVVGRWLRRKWRNPLNTRAMFCSEMIVRVLQASDFPHADTLVPSETTPNDLLVFLALRETP